MAPSHRKKTVGKRTTTTSSPPGDRKLREENACAISRLHRRGLPSSAFKRPGSKLKARTRVNIPWDSGAIPETGNVRPHEPHTPMHRAPHEES
ncbi:hypothetical protein CK203_038886 [Vitis vinifera]|uniref:Uncharacterized protein n=1 Tax=Vitis vinifera TaxID=29760 RepID=A0A438HG32_VITVI|nr:hypothetical protein CK203_038886 [Vitis vinifera]